MVQETKTINQLHQQMFCTITLGLKSVTLVLTICISFVCTTTVMYAGLVFIIQTKKCCIARTRILVQQTNRSEIRCVDQEDESFVIH